MQTKKSKNQKNVTIVGGGISGLSTGWFLSKKGIVADVFEKHSVLGGVSSTFKSGDSYLDFGPHKIYTQIDVMDDIREIIGKDLLTIPKKSRIRLFGKYFNYPVSIKDLLLNLNPIMGLRIGFDYGLASLKNKIRKPKDSSYEDYLAARFGKTAYSLVFESYARKLWGEPKELSADLARTRVSIPSLFEMVKTMIFGAKSSKEITAKEFYYPKKGIITLSTNMAKKIEEKGSVTLSSELSSINISNNKVVSIDLIQNKKTIKKNVDFLVTTANITELVKLVSPKVPKKVLDAANNLHYRNLILLYVVVNKDKLFEDNWIFFPEQKYLFNRLSEQKGFSKEMVPKGKTVLCVEVTCAKNDALWKKSDKDLFNQVLPQLIEADILSKEDVASYFSKKLENVYPVYDLNYSKNLEIIFEYLDSIKNFLSIGRPGLFNYNNMDHCIDMGKKTAEFISNNAKTKDWKKIRQSFYEYKIVD